MLSLKKSYPRNVPLRGESKLITFPPPYHCSSRSASDSCQGLPEPLLNDLLAFEQREQPGEHRFEHELGLSVPHVLFGLCLHQTMAEHKFQVACRDLLGNLLHQALRHILHHHWMKRKHRSCFPSFQQATPPERPERLQALLARERADAFLDQVS